ncbi:hypothetical protein QAD02_017662 [Eretmocerus hayati]|uniref:Uncharacterized protein n=1 Tax=Eretmocerus hayati TaxID=131215 RepID=A0ACC2PJB4_9HYME|nr:hypothetical protein QAD02_017662 [Eretmocerus hayati]
MEIDGDHQREPGEENEQQVDPREVEVNVDGGNESAVENDQEEDENAELESLDQEKEYPRLLVSDEHRNCMIKMWSIFAILVLTIVSSTLCQDASRGSEKQNIIPETTQVNNDPLTSNVSYASLEINGIRYGIATIIDSQFLVTSCSVIQKIKMKSITGAKIIVGITDENPNGDVYHVKDTQCHPEYERLSLANGVDRYIHNIGIIKVDDLFNETRTPFTTIADSTYPNFVEGIKGSIEAFDSDGDCFVIDFKILSNETCKENYINQGGLYYGESCGEGIGEPEDASNICDENEGAPFIVEDHMIGFASWISGCSTNETQPSVITEIARHRHWIDAAKEQINEREESSTQSAITKFIFGESPDARPCRIDEDSDHQISLRDCNSLCQDRTAKKGDCDVVSVCFCREGDERESYGKAKRRTEIMA